MYCAPVTKLADEPQVASKLVTPWAPIKNFADLEFLSDNIAVEGASDSG